MIHPVIRHTSAPSVILLFIQLSLLALLAAGVVSLLVALLPVILAGSIWFIFTTVFVFSQMK